MTVDRQDIIPNPKGSLTHFLSGCKWLLAFEYGNELSPTSDLAHLVKIWCGTRATLGFSFPLRTLLVGNTSQNEWLIFIYRSDVLCVARAKSSLAAHQPLTLYKLVSNFDTGLKLMTIYLWKRRISAKPFSSTFQKTKKLEGCAKSILSPTRAIRRPCKHRRLLYFPHH